MPLPTSKGAYSPSKPCHAPRCVNKVKGRTYCRDHSHLSTSKFQNKQGKPDPFYLTKRWRNTTTAYRKVHPLCEKCEREDRIRPANVTDHKQDWKEGGAKYDWNNLEALCHSCHNTKTGRGNKK